MKQITRISRGVEARRDNDKGYMPEIVWPTKMPSTTLIKQFNKLGWTQKQIAKFFNDCECSSKEGNEITPRMISNIESKIGLARRVFRAKTPNHAPRFSSGPVRKNFGLREKYLGGQKND